ncbi:hypothetical protein ACFVAJ_17130 [Agromyces sp. NPDC057679]|uniref:hypothetical protein n=1 Tax=Agromyces sp. NPDC057679 TaxID=3346207 RepID=UPI00366C71EE
MGLEASFAVVSVRPSTSERSVKLISSNAGYLPLDPKVWVTTGRLGYADMIEAEARALRETLPDGAELWYTHDHVQDLEALDDAIADDMAVQVDDEFFEALKLRAEAG